VHIAFLHGKLEDVYMEILEEPLAINVVMLK